MHAVSVTKLLTQLSVFGWVVILSAAVVLSDLPVVEPSWPLSAEEIVELFVV